MAAVLLAPTARPAAAQQPGGSPSEVASAFARAWSEGSHGTLERLLSQGGISLRLDDSAGHVGVAPRQAAASVARLLARHEPGQVVVRRSEVLGGDPPRALAELQWSARPRGTREVASRIIFLGLERADGGWIVVEIRLLS